VREHCGEMFMGRSVTYVEQENPVAGTANALLCAREVLRDTFLVLMGDDLYGKAGLTRAIAHDLCVIAAESDDPQKFGIIQKDADGNLVDIIERPENPATNLVPTGAMVLDMRIFNYHTEPDPRTGEQYLPDMVRQLAHDHPVAVETLEKWYPIGYPGDVVVVERVLKEVNLTE
jgi:dTDP-glucose pyrophosphorylase